MNRNNLLFKDKRDIVRCRILMTLTIIGTLILAAIEVCASGSNDYIKVEGNNYQGTTKWKYDYTGNTQSFSVPVNGMYRFEIYGAQGANYENHAGGHGGAVFGTIDLEKGHSLDIIVGGTNGYNGGGNGTLSNGGGATLIECNGSLVALAGGGGGASNMTDGNAGGSSASTNENYLYGSDSQQEYSAGGGGGYIGGNSGYTRYHFHEGNETEGGQCYATPTYHAHEGNSQVGEGCYTVPIYHIHEGESTYYGGCYTEINYHEHKGDSLNGGECYTIPKYHTHIGNRVDGGSCYETAVMHEHSSACPSTTCTGTSFTIKQIGTTTCYYCNSCGFGYTGLKSVCGNTRSTCSKGGTVEYYNLSCTLSENEIVEYDIGCGMLTTTPESYALACEKTEESIDSYDPGCGMDMTTIIGYQKSCNKIENETIDDFKAAFGGTNYYNTNMCADVKSSAGVNAGNGSVVLTLISVDGATLSYYSDESNLLKRVTVAKGDSVSYPLSENPTKVADEKYSYTFVGWDNMNTEEVETYSNEETIKDTSSSYNFKAVFEKSGQSYVLSFDNQGAESVGTENVNVIYGQKMVNIEIPKKHNFIFAGYYTQPQGLGKKYYDSTGTSVCNSDITSNTVLYAYWTQPLSIIRQPIDVSVTTGYHGVIIDFDTALTVSGDFTVKYQWYQKQGDTMTPIADATEKLFFLPEEYAIGEYQFFCEIIVTDNSNQHSYTTHSNTINAQVMKGKITESKISFDKNNIIYDEKYHSAMIAVDIASDYTIYYAKEELNAGNYLNIGQNHPFNFVDAGKYEIYYYITSPEYEDYSGKMEYIIYKAKPEIMVLSKNVSYTGEILKIDEAKIIGVNNAILSDCDVVYTYYIDAECTSKTSEIDGAIEEGMAPSKVGSYYIMVHVEEMDNYIAVDTSTPVLLNILQTTVDFEIKGYAGIYDKMEHGVIADGKNNSNISFYYSTEIALTAENYLSKGMTSSPLFKNVGSYKVYYLVVNKLTGKLNSYIPGEATVTIYKAKQYITNENRPILNTKKNTVTFPKGGDWEYRNSSYGNEWNSYSDNNLSEGVYEFRLAENENYYASEAIIIQVKETGIGNSNNSSGNSEKDEIKQEVLPDKEKEDIQDVIPEVIPVPEEIPEQIPEETEKPLHDNKLPTQNDEIKSEDLKEVEISGDLNHNGIPDEYEQDKNGNGIPDIFETDNNGNGIPDYFEWDMNGNGIPDYLEDENQNGIPDFLEWKEPTKQPADIAEAVVVIQEEPVPLDVEPQRTVTDKIKETVKEILAEENAKIVLPCVTVGMVIGLFGTYFVIVLLSPYIKLKTKYRYYIETLLTGKTKKYKVSINTDLASIDETRINEGICSFGQLCKNEDYIITIQDKNNYSVGVIRLTFMKKRVFHEIVINRGIEIRVEQLKHGARIRVR